MEPEARLFTQASLLARPHYFARSGWVEEEVHAVDAVVSWKLNPKRFSRFIQVSRSSEEEAAGFSN